jgi:uncharacterized protein YutE (UPF0331/DUF86 family)
MGNSPAPAPTTASRRPNESNHQSATEKPQRENKELFAILAKMNIIDQELSINLQKMAGMRNILAHEYLEIDKTQVYQAIKENLPDIVHYCQAIEAFLQKISPTNQPPHLT